MITSEHFNAWTHLVGAVAALTGSIILIVLAVAGGDTWKVVGVAIYGATLLLLYTFSTLYHSLHGRARRVMRQLDHEGIYLLIAGTYTPFCLVTLRGPWGWSLLGIVWGLAVLGGLQELRPRGGARILSVVLYLLMGWTVIAAWVPLTHALGPVWFAWLAAGGAFYTIGIVFYALESRCSYAHGVWHLFVLAGSASHYLVILRRVL
jgi:hemolysin III